MHVMGDELLNPPKNFRVIIVRADNKDRVVIVARAGLKAAQAAAEVFKPYSMFGEVRIEPLPDAGEA